MVAALAPAPAAARAADVLNQNWASPGYLLLSSLAALVAGAVLLLLFQRLRRQTSRAGDRLGAAKLHNSRLAKEREAMHAVHSALPDGFVALGPFGEILSGGLAAKLNLSSGVETFADLEPAFVPPGFRRLTEAVERLTREGSAFRLELQASVGQRTYEVTGISHGPSSVVVFRDVSADRQGRARETSQMALLADERDSYRALFDASPFPVWWRDRDLRLVGCNRAYAGVVEASIEEVVEKGIELASAIDAEQPRRLASAALEKRARVNETRRFVVAGERRAYRVHETPVAGGEGLMGFAHDVTDEEEARRELERHIAAHAEVLQSLSAAVAIFGADKRLVFSNRAFAGLWQLDDAWLASGPQFGDVLERLRENRCLPEQVDWRSFKSAQLAPFSSLEPREDLLHLPDGRAIRVRTGPHPFGGLVVSYEDVTRQLLLERSRNTLVAVQRATLDNLYEGVVVFGGDGRIDLYNAAFGRLWNLGEEMLAAKPHIDEVTDACRPLLDDGGQWEQIKERILDPFLERAPVQGRLERPDGEVIDYATVPLPDGAMLYSYLNVSDSIRIERALRDRNDALQAADQLKSEFVANVSYELRTPLNTIIGFTEILANQYFGELNKRQKEYAQGVLDSSHLLLMLINDILDLASIEAGQVSLELERFDLYATMENIVGLVRERARRQSLAVQFDCPLDIGSIEADERRLKQVMFNLLNNAIKFTPPGGTIELGARREENEAVFWVRDNGMGIAETDQPRAFDKFWKRAAPGKPAGAGLGLSLVRAFVEMHHGRVELQSKRNEGTVVTCRLPLRAAGAATEVPARAEPSSPAEVSPSANIPAAAIGPAARHQI